MNNKGKKEISKHININLSWIYVIAICTLILAGCARQCQSEATEQILITDIGKAETMELAEEVLAQLHFTIDKVDTQSGLIRTRPLPGAQFFEFWRGDNVGADNNLQANLHTIRRTVELDITQQVEKIYIGCHVRTQRLSLPEREITSSARAYDMFSRSTPSMQRLALNPEQQKAMAWIDLGEDIPLETEILRRIEERILHRKSNEQQITRNEI
ncbi:hypothetical protein ACFL5Z_03000 [Planctomycetota bacterium]